MATRLDDLHAHQYGMRRVVQALVRHDPDPTGPTRPRVLVLTLVGALIAALLAVGTLVYDALTGQGSPSSLKDSSTVLIEKETGAKYVYAKADDQLHPVLNYASGLLIAEGTGDGPTTVRRSRLAALRKEEGLGIGAPLGIAGAPDALPGRNELLRDPWQVCTRTPAGAGAVARTELLIGAGTVTGGHALSLPAPGRTAEAVLAQAPDKSTYLIFANRKFFIPEPAVALAAFGWTGQQRDPVADGWLNTLPAGSDIKPLAIDGLGEPSHAVQQTVGRLLRTTGTNSDQWALVRRDSVQSISDVQARLLQADQRTNVGDPVTVSTATFGALPFKSEPDAAQDLPATVPNLVPIGSTACVRVPDAATGVAAVVIDPTTVPTSPAPVPSPTGTEAGTTAKSMAGRVTVPFGHGVLVQSSASSTAPAGTGTVLIVTDTGMQYPIADHDAQVRLGFGDSKPLSMPSNVVSLLPAGPSLSTSAVGGW
jgi:type VII secretion protein EccB